MNTEITTIDENENEDQPILEVYESNSNEEELFITINLDKNSMRSIESVKIQIRAEREGNYVKLIASIDPFIDPITIGELKLT